MITAQSSLPHMAVTSPTIAAAGRRHSGQLGQPSGGVARISIRPTSGVLVRQECGGACQEGSAGGIPLLGELGELGRGAGQ